VTGEKLLLLKFVSEKWSVCSSWDSIKKKKEGFGKELEGPSLTTRDLRIAGEGKSFNLVEKDREGVSRYYSRGV